MQWTEWRAAGVALSVFTVAVALVVYPAWPPVSWKKSSCKPDEWWNEKIGECCENYLRGADLGNYPCRRSSGMTVETDAPELLPKEFEGIPVRPVPLDKPYLLGDPIIR